MFMSQLHCDFLFSFFSWDPYRPITTFIHKQLLTTSSLAKTKNANLKNKLINKLANKQTNKQISTCICQKPVMGPHGFNFDFISMDNKTKHK